MNFLTDALFYKARVREAYEKEHGYNPPLLLVISPSMRCNLKCVGCYAGMYSKKDDLPVQVFDRVISEAKEMGIYFNVISGGEPFHYKPLLDMCRKHHDVTFQVYTNGTLIDRDLAHEIAEAGNIIPCISVEGYREETDARRGEGVYEKVIQAMDNLREAKALFGFSATVTRFNTDILTSDEFVDYYMDQKGCFIGWYFQYMPIGTRPSLELMTTPEQRIQRLERINHMRKEKKALISDFWCDGPLVGGCLAGGAPLSAHQSERGRGAVRVRPFRGGQHQGQDPDRGPGIGLLPRHQGACSVPPQPAAAMHGHRPSPRAARVRRTMRGPADASGGGGRDRQSLPPTSTATERNTGAWPIPSGRRPSRRPRWNSSATASPDTRIMDRRGPPSGGPLLTPISSTVQRPQTATRSAGASIYTGPSRH